MDLDAPREDTKTTQNIYADCWLRRRCHIVSQGRFYTCTRPPHFQTFYGKDAGFLADGILLEDRVDMAERLLDYLRRPEPLNACARCQGGNAPNPAAPPTLAPGSGINNQTTSLMKMIIQGTTLGELPHYISAARAIHAPTILELMELLGDGARAIDPMGLRNYFERRPDGKRTCFLGAEFLPAGMDLYGDETNLSCTRRALPNPSGALFPLLETVVKELLAQTTRIAVALSGGLDSALVLALAQRATQHSIPIITIETGLPGYSELEQTMETARLLGANTMEVIKVRDTDLVSSLPESIAACETPLFNLHPVTRFLLSRVPPRNVGSTTILTGDGAYQVFAGSDPRNYLPIVGAMVRSTGLKCLSPFFDERVMGWAQQHGTTSTKRGCEKPQPRFCRQNWSGVKRLLGSRWILI